ncbi:hypothetical protein HO133_006794 [Letharia lupina]|uniref:Uncharacterized protein n=1 Tax=Letharia lupina TaxID=560253 RepID=A0A8H6C6B2_9LECA|nr:uncharacterized protein HO133_006794 [Letharia lupina]KAF6217456.1 hypothetical protein HO133_006794 [Letharia lupina]
MSPRAKVAISASKNTLPSLVLPVNASTLAAPDRPPGFEVEIHYDTSKPFGPLGVYLCAIDCMYHFAQIGWHEALAGGLTVWVDGFDVEIDVESEQGPTGPLKLETSNIIQGLYETMLDVSAGSHFCEVLTTLSLHRRQLGTLVIERRAPRTLEKGSANTTNTGLTKASAQGNTVTYPSGYITDSNDHSFSTSYTYSGTRINSKDVFLAVLDALATAAQFSPSTPFRSLTALSASGNCVINIVEVDSQFQVNYSFVTKALRVMVLDIMVTLRNFGEVTFQLKWKALNIAEGSIQLAGQNKAR